LWKRGGVGGQTGKRGGGGKGTPLGETTPFSATQPLLEAGCPLVKTFGELGESFGFGGGNPPHKSQRKEGVSKRENK